MTRSSLDKNQMKLNPTRHCVSHIPLSTAFHCLPTRDRKSFVTMLALQRVLLLLASAGLAVSSTLPAIVPPLHDPTSATQGLISRLLGPEYVDKY